MSDRRLDGQAMTANVGLSTQVILARLPPEQRTSRDHLRIEIELSSAPEDAWPVSMKPLLGCKGLWVYRFEIPSGEYFRFRLSWMSAPVVRSSAARRLLDFAFRRVVDGGVCPKHLRSRRRAEDGDSELHLGEADYLALLSSGRCACADDGGDISRPFDEDEDKTGRQVESRDDGAGESVEIVRVRNNRTTESCSRSPPWTDANQKRSDDTHTEEPATEFPSPVRQALQLLLTPRAATVRVSKPTDAGHLDPGRVERVEVWRDSDESVSRDKVPEVFVNLQDSKDAFETGFPAVNCAWNPVFTRNESQEVNTAAAAAPGEDADVGRSLSGFGAVTDLTYDIDWGVYSCEMCRREPVRASRRDNVLFAVVHDERVFVLSSASERLKSALTFPSQPMSTDLMADLMQLVVNCESFLKAGGVDAGDPSALGPEDPAVIGYANTLTSEDSDAERPDSDPDRPDSVPDQFMIDNEFRPASLFRGISVRTKDGPTRCHAVTPVDFAFGFEEITLRSESPSPPPVSTAAAAPLPRPPFTTTAAGDSEDSAWSDRRRCGRAAGSLWERSRRAIGRFLSAVGRFFRDRFPLRRRRRQRGRLSSSDLKMLRSRPMVEEDGRV